MNTENTFIKIRISGIIYLMFAAAIVLFSLFSQGYFIFILWFILPLLLYYSIAGYYLFALRLKRKLWVVIPAVLSIFFSLVRIPATPQVIVAFSQSSFYKIILAISFLSGLPFPLRLIVLLANAFVLYAICFSEEKILFSRT